MVFEILLVIDVRYGKKLRLVIGKKSDFHTHVIHNYYCIFIPRYLSNVHKDFHY